MSAELIYKTTSPRAIEWWKAASVAHERDREARRAYEKRMLDEFGPADVPDYASAERRGKRAVWCRGAHAVGLDCGYGEKPPADSGWRLDSKDHIWMPKLATKEGRARAAELAALCTYDIRAHLAEVGIAAMCFANNRLYGPGVEFDEAEGTLYVVWGSGRCAQEAEVAQRKVPEVVWESVRRSEWYAREEAKPASEEENQ